jgi:hypothetical protein
MALDLTRQAAAVRLQYPSLARLGDECLNQILFTSRRSWLLEGRLKHCRAAVRAWQSLAGGMCSSLDAKVGLMSERRDCCLDYQAKQTPGTPLKIAVNRATAIIVASLLQDT